MDTLRIYETLRRGIYCLWRVNTLGNIKKITKGTKGAGTALPRRPARLA